MNIPLSFHIYGPFSIHIYGCMIVLGLFTAYTFVIRDKKIQKLITPDEFLTALTMSVINGIIGGKLLFLAEYCLEYSCTWKDFFYFWETGFSVLGTFIAIIASTSGYLHYKKIPVLALFDRVFLYVPLMFAISRIGCFFAGCCYGLPTTLFFGICYTNHASLAPLGIILHPTQLYSAAAEWLIFLTLYFFIQRWSKKPGQLFGIYLFLMSLERFLIDFLRGDRTLITDYFSISQWVALGVGMFGCLILILATRNSFINHMPRKK